MRAVAIQQERSRYTPVAEYGVIGEGRSAALVSRAGDIDWWSPGRFDAPSLFAALLDWQKGGRWSLAPLAPTSHEMRYVEDTNVLETEHATRDGRIRVRDLIPFEEDVGVSDAIIVRRVTGLEGRVVVRSEFAPRFSYGRVQPRFSEVPAGLLASGAGEIALLRSDLAWEHAERGSPRAEFVVRAGESVDLVLRHAPFVTPVPFAAPLARPIADIEASTIARWRAFADKVSHDGPDAALVRRSALALKLLQYQRNGAFVAAATTSLPESLGGVRNWDYRFTWLRDGVITARALQDVGHADDARRFAAWLTRTVGERAEDMRIMYTLSGSRDLPERELPHLEGYARSAPVRIGNGAATQRQLDVVGELVEFLASTPDRASWPLVKSVADWTVSHWREPDQGIWEMRCEPRHFVLSKAMAWVALDRAAHCARTLGETVPEAWTREAALIREEVFARGYDEGKRAFVQAYGFPAADASNLMLPLVGFIDARDPRMMTTVDRIIEELSVDGLVYRYLGEDGLPGSEATFAYCTFWLAEVLAMQGRVREARAVFDRMVRAATPLGLFAEELDASTGAHLGNFPQAFPHAGLIQASRAIAEAERPAR